MFQLILFLISTASCAQLNNNYLPPPNAASAGGSGPGLKAPNRPSGGSFAGPNVPIAPSRPGAAPSRPGPGPSRPGSAAAPSQPSGPPIEIISYENVNNGDGSYKWRYGRLKLSERLLIFLLAFSYESANGIKAEETGDVKNKGSDNAIQTVQGSYSYTSPEGQVIQIQYTADENGFQAQGKQTYFELLRHHHSSSTCGHEFTGDSLPTPVPLPEENLRALAEFEAAYATGKT